MAFIIIGVPRTGSTHLITLLSGHPQIFCNGNIFKTKHVQLSWPKADKSPEVKKELAALRESDPAAFVDRIFATGYGRPHVGFKIFRGQNDAMLRRLIEEPGIRKIVLYRNNVLANYSSALLARSSGNYRRKSGTQEPATSIKFHERHFLGFHDTYVSFYKTVLDGLRASSQSFWVVNYENLNNADIMSGVIAFIGADSRMAIETESYAKVKKQNSSFIVGRFSNRNAVDSFLAKYNLEHWRYEGETSLSPLLANGSPPRLRPHNDDTAAGSAAR